MEAKDCNLAATRFINIECQFKNSSKSKRWVALVRTLKSWIRPRGSCTRTALWTEIEKRWSEFSRRTKEKQTSFFSFSSQHGGSCVQLFHGLSLLGITCRNSTKRHCIICLQGSSASLIGVNSLTRLSWTRPCFQGREPMDVSNKFIGRVTITSLSKEDTDITQRGAPYLFRYCLAKEI